MDHNNMGFMPWIKIIEYVNADDELLRLYNGCKNPDGTIDRVLKIHSLRPRTLEAHLLMYKATIHTRPNELSYRERELVGTFVSHLNGCNYCFEHHRAGLGRFIRNQDLAVELLENAIGSKDTEKLTEREHMFLKYAEKLTLHPQQMIEDDVEPLKKIGLSDVGILDLNQLIAYFNYVNRSVSGLGVDIAGEKLGFHPNEDGDGFDHV